MIEQSRDSLFFISIEGEGDPVIINLPQGGSMPNSSFSRSNRFSNKGGIEERQNHRPTRSDLESSSYEAHIRRSCQLQTIQNRLAEEARRKREAVAQIRKKHEREQREHCARIREKDFVAQFKRDRLRLIPKSRLLDADLKADNLSEMATLITGTWLRRKIRPVTLPFLNTKILDLASKGKEYEKMQELMMNKTVIKAASDLIIQLVKCDPVANKLTRTNKAGRILLMALLLDGFGQKVMPEASMEELTLLEHASQLSAFLQKYLQNPTRKQQVIVAECWSVFCDSFNEWQNADIEVLVENMQRDHIELEVIARSLEKEANAEWRPHIERHQERLEKALKRVAGIKALEGLQSKLADLKLIDNNNQNIKKDENEKKLEFVKDTADPNDVTKVKEVIGGGIENIHIAHELMVDPNFNHKKLMKLKTGQSFETAYSLPAKTVLSLNNMSDFLQFILMIKGQLQEMLRGTGEIHDQLNEQLDKVFLSEQLSNGALEPYSLLLMVTDCMSKMCAPARDAQIASLSLELDKQDTARLQDVCVELSTIILLMHEDLANFGLMMTKSQISKVIISYEREWFAKNVLDKETPLAEALASRILASSETIRAEERPLTRIHMLILETLLVAMGLEDDLKTEKVQHPSSTALNSELLILDAARLERLASDFSIITDICAINLSLQARSIPGIAESMARIQALLKDKDDSKQNIMELCELELSRNITDNETKTSIKNTIARITNGTDPVARLLKRRIASILRKSLLEDSLDAITSKPACVLVRHGIAESSCEWFCQASAELARVYFLHRDVLSPVYHKLMQKYTHSSK